MGMESHYNLWIIPPNGSLQNPAQTHFILRNHGVLLCHRLKPDLGTIWFAN